MAKVLTASLVMIWAVLACCGAAEAAETKSTLTMLINEKGSVEVIDRWEGMAQESGVFNYFSAAKEVGVVPVQVRNNGFTLSFATRSYLRFEDGYYHFVTPDFYYAEGPIDVELSLTYPPNLVYLDANIEPSYYGDGVIHWSLADCSHTLVIARFERIGPFVQPGQVGPDFQVDPAGLEQLSAEELPHSADEVLKELENIIMVAGASESTDPDFLRVMQKLLAKFYYVLASNGLLVDYVPPAKREPEEEEAAEAPQQPQAPENEQGEGEGTLGTGAGAAGR